MEPLEFNKKTGSSINLKDFLQKSKQRLERILHRSKIKTELKNLTSKKLEDNTANLNKNDPPLPESFMSNEYTVKLDQNELQKLLSNKTIKIPERFSDLQVNFNCEQKLKIYEYVLQRTGKFSEPELKIPFYNEGNKTFAEIVAAENRERKQKQRRHRKSKPTHIEEVRSLVELQMLAMEQYMKKEKHKIHRHEKSRKDIKRTETYSSRSNRSRSIERRSPYHHSNHYKHDRSKHKTRSRSRDRYYKSSSNKRQESKHRDKTDLNSRRRYSSEHYKHKRSKSPDIHKKRKKHKRGRSSSYDGSHTHKKKHKHYE
ncbi:pre-mRNA-splicing factor 38B-like [Teleopsis dalmanni]|uniref:pre-mRNA-splicing factor 38B-like n=1 Tax=Teleopsis dalmanni TaxID=139649 RepID=UPI0018CF9DD2|nr:pre-mRNA-splicing factor 38B-like [Teleopsis dalmanni]